MVRGNDWREPYWAQTLNPAELLGLERLELSAPLRFPEPCRCRLLAQY
jgi:hypothetical protein